MHYNVYSIILYNIQFVSKLVFLVELSAAKPIHSVLFSVIQNNNIIYSV